jgi:hypothetical protein
MPFWKRANPVAASPADAPRGSATGPGEPAPAAEVTDEQLLDAVAGRVVRMRLGVAAVFFLESSKPLSFVGSQVLVFLQPFVEAFLTVRSYQRFAHLMEDRANVERLIQRVEALDEELRASEKREKQERQRRKAESKARGGTAAGSPPRGSGDEA